MRTNQGVELKRIPGAPNDDYAAGIDGQVYSRTRYAGFGRKERTDWYPLKGHLTKKGYRAISLCHENRKVTKAVHRLVCMAFRGLPPSPSSQVCHADGNRDNNAPSNLHWSTQQENWLDRKAHGRGIEGEKHHAARLTDIERGHVSWAVEKGLCSIKHAARMLGMAQSSIQQLVHAARSFG